MRGYTIISTQDGHWLARCTRTGTVCSGATQAEALAELRRLRSTRMVPA